MFYSFARCFFHTAGRVLRSRDGKAGLVLVIVGVVCLLALHGTDPARLKSKGHKAFELTSEGYAASGSKQNHAIKDGTARPDREQQIAGGSESDRVRFRNFFFKIAPWVIIALLAIRFGHFSPIRKLGKLILVLLAAMAIILSVGSGMLGGNLKSPGMGNVRRIEILIIGCTVVAWLIVTVRILAGRPRTRHGLGSYQA